MRRTLLFVSTAISAFAASSAFAADLPARAPAEYAPVIAPLPTWTGFYIGGNVGYGWGDGKINGVGRTGDVEGVIGGGQVGYNWQFGQFVFGVEGDFQGSDQNRTDVFRVGRTRVSVHQELPWLATLRGRIGWAPGPWLIYATGGAAWANYKVTASALGLTASSEDTKTAWTIGGGVEWMFLPKWSTKVEYLYVDTGDTHLNIGGFAVAARAHDNIVRVGVNYHF
jgi:outer membrane immunogenic protein